MPKARTEFVCRECGFRTPRSLGRCPSCDAWGAFDEVADVSQRAQPAPRTNGVVAKPVRLADIDASDFARLPVGINEFARVLGGGIVRGSLTLVGGDPGVGKSTLLTQLAHAVASRAGEVLYISGEESLAQVGLRARRMGMTARDLLFLSETDADLSAAEVAERTGMSRATAQRYLSHLHEVGRVDIKLRYGSGGRPEHGYKWKAPAV